MAESGFGGVWEIRHRWTIDDFADASDYLMNKAAAQRAAEEQAKLGRHGGG